MSGISSLASDVVSGFKDVASTVEGWFGGGDTMSAAEQASAVASDTSTIDAIGSATGDAAQAAAESATAGQAIDDLNNTALASYVSGAATGDFGSAAADAIDSSDLAMTPTLDYTSADFNTSSAPFTETAISTATNGASATQNATSGGWLRNLFGSSSSSAPAASGGMSDLTKLMIGNLVGGLATAGVQGLGAYLASKPHAPANFSGRTSGGGGGGLRMTTTNGGFGLQQGGTEAAPKGVPNALIPTSQATALGGQGGLGYVNPPSTGQSPNLQQTVANQAGVGGLIPQGAVNYMKGPANG